MKTIDDLAVALVQAKQKEQEAIAARHSIEATILERIEAKTEGTAHVTGERFKATATFGMARTVDEAALSAIWPSLSEGLRRIFTTKHGIDTRELRHWQQNEPTEYALAAQAITAKPSKPAVKVEMIAVAEKEAA